MTCTRNGWIMDILMGGSKTVALLILLLLLNYYVYYLIDISLLYR